MAALYRVMQHSWMGLDSVPLGKGVTMGLGFPQERPKSAVFANETKVKMSVEEQIDRMKRHQSGSMKEKRRSLQLPGSQQPDTPGTKAPTSYKVVSPCTHWVQSRIGFVGWAEVPEGAEGALGAVAGHCLLGVGAQQGCGSRRCAGTAASMRWTSLTWRQRCGLMNLARCTRHPERRSPGCAKWSWSHSTMMWTSTRR